MKIRLPRPRIKKEKSRMKRVFKFVKKGIRILSLGYFFRDDKGDWLPYVKEIFEDETFAIIRFRGSIDASTIPIVDANLRDTIREFLDKDIIVDFNEVTHVDSATLASLILILNNLKKNHRKLAVINANDALKNYFSIEKIDKLVHVYKSEGIALRYLGKA